MKSYKQHRHWIILSDATYRSDHQFQSTEATTTVTLLRRAAAREESFNRPSPEYRSVSVCSRSARRRQQHRQSSSSSHRTQASQSRQSNYATHQVESLKDMLFNLGSMYESSVVIRRCVDEHLSSPPPPHRDLQSNLFNSRLESPSI